MRSKKKTHTQTRKQKNTKTWVIITFSISSCRCCNRGLGPKRGHEAVPKHERLLEAKQTVVRGLVTSFY